MTTPNPVSPSLAQKGEEERVAFEKAHDKLFGYQYDSSLAYERRTVDEHLYRYADVQRDWEVWQAARTTPDHRDERIAEPKVFQENIVANLRFCVEQSSQKAVAKHIGISAQYLNDILQGRRDISEEVAAKLGYARVVTFEPLSNSLPTEEDK
jgi:hypothetical protein